MIKGTESFLKFRGQRAELVRLNSHDYFSKNRIRYEGHVGVIEKNGHFTFDDVLERDGTRETRYFMDGAEFRLLKNPRENKKGDKMIIKNTQKFERENAGAVVRLISLGWDDAYRTDRGYRGNVIGKYFRLQGDTLYRDILGHRSFCFIYGAKFELIKRGGK
jgi:hypothetical protein